MFTRLIYLNLKLEEYVNNLARGNKEKIRNINLNMEPELQGIM